MNQLLLKLLTGIVLVLVASDLVAQTEEIVGKFRKLDPADEQRLREMLARPLPSNLPANQRNELLLQKESAARLLGDDVQIEAVAREAVKALPGNADKLDKLASILILKGQFEEGNALRRESIAASKPAHAALLTATATCDLYLQNQDHAARVWQVEVDRRIKIATESWKDDADKNFVFRARGRQAYCISLLEGRSGRLAEAISAADSAEQHARKAMEYVDKVGATQRLNTRFNLAVYLRQRVEAYRSGGRMQDAEKALADFIQFSREAQLEPRSLASILQSAGNLRFSQREFSQSEELMRKADDVLARLGWPEEHPLRTESARGKIQALSGQRKWPDALQALEQLDQLAGSNPSLQRQVRYPYARGIVYLGNQRDLQAAPLFGSLAQDFARSHPIDHFLVAEATGLQGVALWRSGVPESRAHALPLLKAAVRSYMAPSNADFVENVGMRKELREWVFAAYLEAVSGTPGEDAMEAIGAADWIRAGIVQEAVNDAAARAAASNPAIADTVRREQDAKNESAGLRRYLSGEAGSSNSPLPVVAAKMRERIAVLEAERAKLRLEIKARFPDYEQLVRPAPPSIQDLASRLEPRQALLMLLPVADAVYVWAVAHDRPAGFARVAMSETRLDALVKGLRRQLDLDAGADAGVRYDSAAAFELYDRLLSPVARVWQGKTQLLVAAGGALSQLPFAVLQTRPHDGFGPGAPWLVREASITQIPSLSAWLALKAVAKAQSAPQAFIGWGDPVFRPQITAAENIGATVHSRGVTLTRKAALADLDAPEKTISAPSALQYSEIPTLPATRDELLAIVATLNADASRDVILGAEATRESVLAASRSGLLASRRVVAFATHGLMAGDLPNLNQPALAMAATGKELHDPLAPLLTLEDVLALKLNADWVVLSACNTAAADGKAEEALSGLARGFFYAGSRSLLVTHWAVESESAKLLTTATFAHYMANPQAAKAESLREAMLMVMTLPRYAHPAFWAPYALVGDGGR